MEDSKPVAEGDTRIMSEILKHDWKGSDLRIINECRMKLNVTFISDIVAMDGKRYCSGFGTAVQVKPRLLIGYGQRQLT